jgi:hypothetical protein
MQADRKDNLDTPLQNGQAAENSELIDSDQLVKMQELLKETQADVGAFFDHVGVTGFSDMTVRQWKYGVARLNDKKRLAAEKAARP